MHEGISPLEREIASGKPVITFTVGDSMEPLLYNKDTRVVIRKAQGALKTGDIPVYKRPNGQFVMHRIIKVTDDCYYTRGDNRFGCERVPKDWVLAVVYEIFRKNKHYYVTDIPYRSYVRFWMMSYPVRWGVYILKRLLSKIKRKYN